MGIKQSERAKPRSEKKVGKAKQITLLSILSVVMAFLLVMTFIRFPIGVKNYNSVVGAIDLDYDIVGGTAYTLTWSDENTEEVEDIDEVLDTLRYRMRELGYKVFNVKALNSVEEGVEDYEIRIEGKDTLSSDIDVISAYGEVTVVGGTSQSGNPEICTEEKAIADARYVGSLLDADGNTKYEVKITFTDYGYDEIISLIEQAASGENSSSTSFYMGIKVGDTTVLQESTIDASYFNKKSLSLYPDSESDAKKIALQIRSGGLAYKYDVSEGVDITSPLGENVALKCLIAILAILVAFFVFYAIAYRGFGLIMSLSLLAFALLETLMLIAVPGIVLSIGGVVGIGGAIVLTALALTLIGNSVKSEFVCTEKTVKAAVKKGFKDMIMPIVNLFVVSAVVAGALLIFATGALQCFAITFGIGVIIGIIAALAFSRMFSWLILPIAGYSEKFLGVKRVEA